MSARSNSRAAGWPNRAQTRRQWPMGPDVIGTHVPLVRQGSAFASGKIYYSRVVPLGPVTFSKVRVYVAAALAGAQYAEIGLWDASTLALITGTGNVWTSMNAEGWMTFPLLSGALTKRTEFFAGLAVRGGTCGLAQMKGADPSTLGNWRGTSQALSMWGRVDLAAPALPDPLPAAGFISNPSTVPYVGFQ